MKHLLLTLMFLGPLAWPQPVQAQDIASAFRERKSFQPVPLLTEVKTSIGAFTSIANTTFKPEGAGPFPAVVLMHTCGGVHNPHIRQHARELLNARHVVLVLDSFEPRGMKNCSSGPLSTEAGVIDAYAALAFLARQPFVSPARIYQTGYSWGGLVGNLLASPQSAALAASPLRFRATVSHYATCVYQSAYTFVLKDSDRPLLLLLGEKDEELPPASCFPLLEQLQAAGAPVHWHVIAGATHGWDKQGQRDRGYVYDEAHANEATRRLLAFIAQNP